LHRHGWCFNDHDIINGFQWPICWSGNAALLQSHADVQWNGNGKLYLLELWTT
jgi:hypothetical protein